MSGVLPDTVKIPMNGYHNSYNSICAAYATLTNRTKPTGLVIMIINIAYCQYHVTTFPGKNSDDSLPEALCVLVAAFEMRPTTTHYSLNNRHLHNSYGEYSLLPLVAF